MALIDWPLTLPQDVEVTGYENPFPDVNARSQMEAGPAFVRSRFTAAEEPAKWTVELTRAQVTILKDFYRTDLQHGSLRFNFPHPRLLTPVEVRFVTPPDPRPKEGGKLWGCVLDLEVLP